MATGSSASDPITLRDWISIVSMIVTVSYGTFTLWWNRHQNFKNTRSAQHRELYGENRVLLRLLGDNISAHWMKTISNPTRDEKDADAHQAMMISIQFQSVAADIHTLSKTDPLLKADTAVWMETLYEKAIAEDSLASRIPDAARVKECAQLIQSLVNRLTLPVV